MGQDLVGYSSSYGKTRHHISLIPKYLMTIFRNERIKIVCEHSFYETAEKYGLVIRELGFDINHLHLIVDIPPRYSVSQVIKLLKGRSSRRLFKTFPWLRRKFFWGGRLWSTAYYFDSIGDVKLEVIERYVREQGIKGNQERIIDYAT